MKLFLTVISCGSLAGTLLGESRSVQTNVVQVTAEFVNQLADEAQTNNPALRSAEALVDAARANEESVRTWEDPTIQFGVNPARRSFRASDGDLIYGVEQPLPLFGKPKARRLVAQVEMKIEEAKSVYQFQQLRKDIAQNIFRAALANRTLEISEQDLGWIETMLAVAEQRYELGSATQFDVLRMQNERSKRIEQAKTDAQLLEQEQVNLNRLLNRDFKSTWPKLELPPVAPPIAYNDRLVRIALRNEPKLKMMQRQIQQAEAATDMTRRERYPNFSVGGEVRNYSGNGSFRQGTAIVSFNIPWGNRKKYDAAIQREEARKLATSLDAADYELAVQNEIHNLTVKIDTARREALLYRDEILPRSQIALSSARAGWESNAGMFRDVLDARRMVLDAQLSYARAISQQYQWLSELVLCCGLGDLEALQIIGGQIEQETPQPRKTP